MRRAIIIMSLAVVLPAIGVRSARSDEIAAPIENTGIALRGTVRMNLCKGRRGQCIESAQILTREGGYSLPRTSWERAKPFNGREVDVLVNIRSSIERFACTKDSGKMPYFTDPDEQLCAANPHFSKYRVQDRLEIVDIREACSVETVKLDGKVYLVDCSRGKGLLGAGR